MASNATDTAAQAAEAVQEGFLSLHDAKTWILISFLIFFAIMWKYTRGIIIQLLDNRTDDIRDKLEEAENLRKEAQKLHDDYKEKHKKASDDAKKIISDAQAYAKELKDRATIEARHQAERREKILRNRIKKAETEALRELNSKVVDLAGSATRIILEKNIKNNEKLVEETLSSIPKEL